YVQQDGKQLFAISVPKSQIQISVGNNIYVRKNGRVQLLNPPIQIFQPVGYARISSINVDLEALKARSTDSKFRLIEHYQSILKMIDSLTQLLYPQSPAVFTMVKEGKVLARILYSSMVDNFETYLSDILFEIYLAKPETLKSE